MFGAVLYDGTRRGGIGGAINEASILTEYTDVTDGNFIAPELPTDNARRTTIENYVVQNGDTLSEIAETFQISPNTIRWANNLSSNTLRV